MVSAARDFTAFNEVAQYVRIVKTDAPSGPRYAVVGIDGKTRARGNSPAFILDRASWWENHYADPTAAIDLAADVADALTPRSLRRPADDDRAGGRNTLTRFADLDEAS
jgi:hypothetical protein